MQIPNQQTQRITSKEFAAKYKDKREVYRFLACDAHLYLDSFETMTIWHLKDLAAGRKKKIISKDVKHISIPQYEGLSIADLLEYAKSYPAVMQALPVEREIKKLSKQYIANVIYTIVGAGFIEWVEDRVRSRNERVT
jgi:hypothetical protein